jgi:hypothetical protein
METRQQNKTHDVIFQHPVALYRSDLAAFVPSMCHAVHYSFFVLQIAAHNIPHTQGSNTTEVTETPTINDYDGQPTHNPARAFKAATTNKPNKTVTS